MSSLPDHPTVKRFWEKAKATPVRPGSAILDAQWLRQLCLDAGADDVGFVDIDRPELGNERADIVRFFQPTKALISFVLRMNREPIRSPARSAANVEFHQTGERVNEVAHHIVTALGNRGVRAINPAMGFPMEVDRIGAGKIWIVSHKPVAVAAGLGHMGTIANFMAASSIGWSRLSRAKAHATTVIASVIRNQRQCGGACRSAPTTNPLTAWPCVRQARM